MIYKITTNSAPVKSKPVADAPIMGRLEISTMIEVIEVSKKWATIIYEGNESYVSTMYIKLVEDETQVIEPIKISEIAKKEDEVVEKVEEPVEVSEPVEKVEEIIVKEEAPVQKIEESVKLIGSVTIKYIDYDDKVEMNPDRVYNDLDLNTYVFGAKAITGYFNVGSCYEEITLNENEYEKNITFYYKKRFGSVTVRHIDFDSKKEIEPCEVYKNLVFDEYIYSSKVIDGYHVLGDSTKIVSIDDTLTNCEVYFEYVLSQDK